MFYLIGLGLNEKGYSREAYDAITKCKKIYVDNYTIEFPYEMKNLEKQFPKEKFILLNREAVEGLEFLGEARKTDVALLVYGSPLTATTHITILKEAKTNKIKTKVIYSASILDAIAETGLQIYKFGKITSMPNFEAESFIGIVKENLKINAHSLILIDINMEYLIALERLEKLLKKNKIETEEIVVCSKLGTEDQKIFYGEIPKLRNKKIEAPFCFIIPGELHFMEKEFLENYQK